MKALETLVIIMVSLFKGIFMVLIPFMSMCFSTGCSLLAGISQSQSGSHYPSRTTNAGNPDTRFNYTPNQADAYIKRNGD